MKAAIYYRVSTDNQESEGTSLQSLDYESRRLALDMLGITVWVDDENVEITGTINPETGVIANMFSPL